MAGAGAADQPRLPDGFEAVTAGELGGEVVAGHAVAGRAGVIGIARQDYHLDDRLLADGDEAGVDGGAGEGGVVGVNVGAPEAAADLPRDFDEVLGADLVAEAYQVAGVGDGSGWGRWSLHRLG